MNNFTKIAKKYRIEKAIGSGKFGEVCKGINEKNGELVAIKFESPETPTKLIKHETTILKYLYDHGCRNIPTVFWFGIWNHYSVLIMPFLECSLYDKIKSFHKEQRALPMEKIHATMVSAIDIIMAVHKNYVIHRDIKPQNFMLKNGELYLIDFGLATFYIDDNRKHVVNAHSSQFITGTPKYVSYNIFNGDTPSRRDDLISLGYIFIWMACGELSWDNIIDDGTCPEIKDEGNLMHNKNQQRKNLKSWENIKCICEKIDQPLFNYLNYFYNLRFEEEPNYSATRELWLKHVVPSITGEASYKVETS